MSWCVECDAAPGDCEHTGARYLAPLRYTLVAGTCPREYRWSLPDLERWRFDHPQSSWPSAPRAQLAAVAEPLPFLIASLAEWVDLDDSLEGLLRETYAHDPLKTSRLVTGIIDKSRARTIRSPGGLLFSRLRKLRDS